MAVKKKGKRKVSKQQASLHSSTKKILVILIAVVILTSVLTLMFMGKKEVAGKAVWTGADSDLIAKYTFNSLLTDASSNSNDGTIQGTATYVGGIDGKALSINGDDYVDLGKGNSLNFGEGAPFTFAGWVKTTDNYGAILSFRNNIDGGAVIDIAVGFDGIDTASGKLMALVRQDNMGKGQARITGETINDEEWHHFVLTRNEGRYDASSPGGTIELFLDGILQDTNKGENSWYAITTDLRSIGSERKWVADLVGNDDKQYFEGIIDEVKIYGRQLSADEIRDMYDEENPSGGGGPDSAVGSRVSFPSFQVDSGLVVQVNEAGNLIITGGSTVEEGDACSRVSNSFSPGGFSSDSKIYCNSSSRVRICNNNHLSDINDNLIYCNSSLRWQICGSSNENEISDHLVYCSEPKWWKCDGGVGGNESRVFGNFICSSSQWRKCGSIGNKGLIGGDKYYCDGLDHPWKVCVLPNPANRNPEPKKTKIGQEYVCSGSNWEPCFNKFCWWPDTGTIEGALNTELSKYYLAIQAIPSSYPLKGKTVGDALDLAENKAFSNSFIGILPSTASTEKIFYFKYNQKNYKIELTAFNQVQGTATLQVIALADNSVKGQLNLAMTEASPIKFPTNQVGVNLEGTSEPEVYLTAFGLFDWLKKLQVRFIVNPKGNLNIFNTGTFFAVSGIHPLQTFSLSGEHTLNLAVEGTNVILFIDGKEYTALSGTHYFDPQQNEGVDFSVTSISGISSASVVLTNKKTGGSLGFGYEDDFTKTKSVKVRDNLYQICTGDPAVLQTVTVCIGETEKFALLDKRVQVHDDTLFLYQAPTGNELKAVRVFNLKNLSIVEPPLPPVVEKAFVFANSLIQEKRLALALDEGRYLFSHPKANYLNLPSLSLTEVSNTDFPKYLAEGNQEEVIFNLPLGKQIGAKLNLAPELSYTLSAKTSVRKVVNLLNELQTKVSTYGTVTVNSPELGNVAVSSDDIKTFKNKMKISYGTETIELNYQDFQNPTIIPASVSKPSDPSALLYYNQFTNAGANTFNKYADIYLYYNLSKARSAGVDHAFTDLDFILPIVKGGKIAFDLEKSYYLLSYSEPWNPLNPTGFALEKLQLTTLDGSKTYAPQITETGELVFDVAPRQIKISVDTNTKLITFKGVTAVDTAKTVFDLEKDYYTTLPTSNLPTQKNLLQIGSSDYYNCDNSATKLFGTYFLLCIGDERTRLQVNVSQPVEKFGPLIWFREMKNNQKKITFQKIFTVSDISIPLNWEKLTGNLAQQKNPILKWNSLWFELSGDTELKKFELKAVPSGEKYPIVMQSYVEGHNNGTIIIKENLFQLTQNLDEEYEVNLLVKHLPEKLATGEGFNVTGAQAFVPSLGAPAYTLTSEKIASSDDTVRMVKLSLAEGGVNFFNTLLPEKASKRVMLPNGEAVTLEVLNATTKPLETALPIIKLKK